MLGYGVKRGMCAMSLHFTKNRDKRRRGGTQKQSRSVKWDAVTFCSKRMAKVGSRRFRNDDIMGG